jgi:regulator of replication initiation timing
MQDLIIIENGEIAPKTLDFIKVMETQMKTLKEQYDGFKTALLEAMEKNGVTKFDGDGIKINYIAETEREDLDKKKFKEELPELYDSYVKFVKVKASVRIKVEK